MSPLVLNCHKSEYVPTEMTPKSAAISWQCNGGGGLQHVGAQLLSAECYLCGLPHIGLVTPAPVGTRGIVFGRFLSLFQISISATLRENGWTDLHEIFGEGVE